MVITVDSFSSDESTHERDQEVKSLLSPKSATITMGATIESPKDIEQNAHRSSTVVNKPSPDEEQPRVVHPSLLKIPMQARFILAGTLSNIVFVSMYNSAMPWLHHQMAASTIYAIVYFVFIPISHALNAMVVFGWPKDYGTSLLSNFPIGLSAILIGSFCTAYLDKTNFEAWADDFVNNVIMNKPRVETDDVQELGEFYSSLVVMVITGIWSYVISVMVNTPTKEPHKKEL